MTVKSFRDSCMDGTTGEITRLAERWGCGDAAALDRLIELAYDDLRKIAHRQLRSWESGGTINTTALVHELYFRLAGIEEVTWGGRGQFLAFCAKAMRRILIDFSRRRASAKRGGGWVRVPITEADAAVQLDSNNMVALDTALNDLASRHARMAQVVECRYFGGLSVEETAEALSTSIRTVEREWTRARAWLRLTLTSDSQPSALNSER